MNAVAQMGTRADPVWAGSSRAAALVMRSAFTGPTAGRVARVEQSLSRVLPSAGKRFREALGRRAPTRAAVERAATVGLSNALLDWYMELGLRVWESKSDPRVINPLKQAGLMGLGALAGDEKDAEGVMLDIACNPATVGVVSGVVGAVTYGIGGAIVGAGGGVAQQMACAARSSPGASPTPAPRAPAPPPPPPEPALPRWLVPVAAGLAVVAVGGLLIYGVSS